MLIREMQAAAVNTLQAGQTIGQLYPTCTYLEGANGPAYRRNDATGSVRWYLYDGLGSVVGEVDPNGCVTSGGTYDVYGAPRAGTQFGAASSRQGFVGGLGHQTDAETGGLIYMQARYYDSGTGRFVSEDPSQNGSNWYVYAQANPVNYIDLSGRSDKAIADFGQFIYEIGVGMMTASRNALVESIMSMTAAYCKTLIASSIVPNLLQPIADAAEKMAELVAAQSAIGSMGTFLVGLQLALIGGIIDALGEDTPTDVVNDLFMDGPVGIAAGAVAGSIIKS